MFLLMISFFFKKMMGSKTLLMVILILGGTNYYHCFSYSESIYDLLGWFLFQEVFSSSKVNLFQNYFWFFLGSLFFLGMGFLFFFWQEGSTGGMISLMKIFTFYFFLHLSIKAFFWSYVSMVLFNVFLLFNNFYSLFYFFLFSFFMNIFFLLFSWVIL